MGLSNLALCYEGIQRVYRNSIVNYVRSKFTAAFGDKAIEELKKPFLKEWEKIAASAQERRGTGELAAEIKDEFDLLGVNHFFNLFEVHASLLCAYSSGANSEQMAKERSALLQWMKTVKNLRDPLSHPSDEDFSFEDAFVLLDCARRILGRLHLDDEAAQIQALVRQLSGRPLSANPETEPLEDRLPPSESIVTGFVGRQVELQRLWEWLGDPVSRRWLLAGEGGKGKSALAFEFGRDMKLKAPEPFQIVLWLSAKKRRFQEGTVVPVDYPDFHDLDTALSCLLRHYGWVEETELPFERRRTRVLELFDQFPALVIVDDVDSLEGEGENAIEFFTLQAPQTKSKILFTSRRVVFGMANVTTHVGGLSDTDAERFIVSRAQVMGLDAGVLVRGVVRDVIRITEGSPLYIGDLLRLFAVMPPRDALRLWQEKAGEEARRYALGRELELLSEDARHILVAACINGRFPSSGVCRVVDRTAPSCPASEWLRARTARSIASSTVCSAQGFRR